MEQTSVPVIKPDDLFTTGDTRYYMGCGSSAHVRRCWNKRFKEDVAVKLYTVSGSQEEIIKREKMIKKEADVHFHLIHDNIVKCYGSLVLGQATGLVLEYLPLNLEDLIVGEKPIPDEIKPKIFSDICQGLKYLHSYKNGKSIVHEDLKPQNVLISRNGVAKISDMGSANFIKAVEASKDSLDGYERCHRYTHYYLAPERLKDCSSNCSTASDVFSLGVTGLELLMNKLCYCHFGNPFVFESLIEKGEVLDKGFSAEESSFQGDLAVIKSLIKDCLSFSPQCRPNIEQVCSKLKSAKFKVKRCSVNIIQSICKLKENQAKTSEMVPLSNLKPPYRGQEKSCLEVQPGCRGDSIYPLQVEPKSHQPEQPNSAPSGSPDDCESGCAPCCVVYITKSNAKPYRDNYESIEQPRLTKRLNSQGKNIILKVTAGVIIVIFITLLVVLFGKIKT